MKNFIAAILLSLAIGTPPAHAVAPRWYAWVAHAEIPHEHVAQYCFMVPNKIDYTPYEISFLYDNATLACQWTGGWGLWDEYYDVWIPNLGFHPPWSLIDWDSGTVLVAGWACPDVYTTMDNASVRFRHSGNVEYTFGLATTLTTNCSGMGN